MAALVEVAPSGLPTCFCGQGVQASAKILRITTAAQMLCDEYQLVLRKRRDVSTTSLVIEMT